MFQLFTLISHSIQHSKSFIIPYSDELYDGDTRHKTYWETLFDNIKVPFVITPHYGEMSRILDIESQLIENQ